MQTCKKDHQAGQVGVVVLLVAAVVLTVAVGLSHRTLQQQESAITQDESLRVFNAAESGVESALYDIAEHEYSGTELGTGDNYLFPDDSGPAVSYNITQSAEFEMFVSTGDTVEIALDNPSNSDSITISWQHVSSSLNCDTDNPPAIIASVISFSTARQYAFDPCAAERGTEFQFVNFIGGDYPFSTTVPLETGDLLIRIKPIFTSTNIGIAGTPSNIIALAQYDIDSTAFNSQEKIARTIEVKRSLPGSYSFMDFTLVSGSTLTK